MGLEPGTWGGGGTGSVDPVDEGIRQGLARAYDTDLPVREIDGRALADMAADIVRAALRRQVDPSSPQIVLFAETVTTLLAAGVDTDTVDRVLESVCEKWRV